MKIIKLDDSVTSVVLKQLGILDRNGNLSKFYKILKVKLIKEWGSKSYYLVLPDDLEIPVNLKTRWEINLEETGNLLLSKKKTRVPDSTYYYFLSSHDRNVSAGYAYITDRIFSYSSSLNNLAKLVFYMAPANLNEHVTPLWNRHSRTLTSCINKEMAYKIIEEIGDQYLDSFVKTEEHPNSNVWDYELSFDENINIIKTNLKELEQKL